MLELVLDLSQLNGDLLAGCGCGAGGVGCGVGAVAVEGRNGVDSLRGTCVLAAEVVVFDGILLVEDLENLLVRDSTNEGVGGAGGSSAVAGGGSFDGGNSSMSETSSSEAVEIRRWLSGDLGWPGPFS